MERCLRAAVLVLVLGMVEPSLGQGFLRAQGRFVGNDTGLVQLRGLGIGGWMLQEGYMVGTESFAGTQHEIRAKIESVVGKVRSDRFYQLWLDRFLTREDVDSLARWGFNSLRLPMHWNLFMEPGLPIRWKEDGFRRTDSLLSWCEANRMWLILDLHAAPGGQGTDNNISDRDPANPSLWDSEENRTMVLELWKRLAGHYRDKIWIGGYDLLNEPNWSFEGSDQHGCQETRNAPLRQLQVDLTTAIRKVDPNHLVIAEGNCWGGNYAGLMPPWDANMALSFHKYWNSPDVGTVNPYFALRDSWSVPLWLGESGENGNEWFKRTIRMAESERIGWSWWPFKKIESTVGPLSVSTTGGWKEFIAWGKGGAKPDSATLDRGLEELAENLRLSRCRVQRDVLDAMFRQVRSDSTLPWRPLEIPGSFGAEDYDLGGDGFAYHDSNSMNIGIEGKGAWNQGWSFRNDGVDLQWSASEQAWNIGWLEEGEWIRYSFDVPRGGQFSLLARTAGPGGEMDLSIDGSSVGSLVAPATLDWNTWTDTRSGTIALGPGRHVLKIRCVRSGANLGRMRWTLATDACTRVGGCTSVRRDPAGESRWFSLDGGRLRSQLSHPQAVNVFQPDGRILFKGTLNPRESIQLGPFRGLVLVHSEGGRRDVLFNLRPETGSR